MANCRDGAENNAPWMVTPVNATGRPVLVTMDDEPGEWASQGDGTASTKTAPATSQTSGSVACLLANVLVNHSDFLADADDLTNIPQGPTGLEAWPDVLVRLTRAPFVSIALIRGRATGNGSELALACDMTFASREQTVLSQWEVGAGLVAGGGPMARLPRQLGRQRALEVLLAADDITGADAERIGYVNRALPDAQLDDYVEALATRIASFDSWAIANAKRLVGDACLPPDVEIRAGWDTFLASSQRPAAQANISALLAHGLQKPGDTEDRLGLTLGRLASGAGS
jgi:enoyl-CoA hydratase/carnithine racemase